VIKGTREVIGVQVRVDGGGWNDTIGIYNWSFSLNAKQLKNGKHTLEIRAYDGKEYSDTLRTDLTVHNSAPAKGFIPAAGGMLLVLLLILSMFVGAFRRKGRPPKSHEVGE